MKTTLVGGPYPSCHIWRRRGVHMMPRYTKPLSNRLGSMRLPQFLLTGVRPGRVVLPQGVFGAHHRVRRKRRLQYVYI